MTTRSTPQTDDVPVLELDPSLGEELAEGELAVARDRVVASVVSFDAGPWEPPGGGADMVGWLLVDGLLGREVRLAGFPCTELLGSGDVLRPWDQDSTIPVTVEWTALAAGRVAVLDHRFVAAIGHWPQLGVALLRRSVRRSQSLATHLAITCLVGLELRIHTLLWHLAGRWGRMTPNGVVLELPLTHEAMAHLVRSRRPSVSAALKNLADDGKVIRQDDDRWLLPGQPPTNLEEVAGQQMRRMHESAD